RARRAVEHSTPSGISRWRARYAPMRGAASWPRRLSGRSWSLAPGSDQDDFAWRSSNSRRMVHASISWSRQATMGRGMKGMCAFSPRSSATGVRGGRPARGRVDMNEMVPADVGASWYAQRAPAFERPRLAFDLDVDVCVVGAGLAGLTVAREVARRGWSV